eukprot:9844261-Alexandrium_andersonii.AAC.1
MPASAAAALCDILRAFERGCAWPDQLLRAKCAYLPKEEATCHQALKLRGSLMLSCVYRTWSKLRLRALQSW